MYVGNPAKRCGALIEITVDKETRELLAWYVNGTLAGADRDRVEAALQNDAGAALLLAWERGVQAAVKG
ncbi:MAG: zf-HC2 domain-containing protein, partial [Acidobacteriota bacterium]